MKGETEANITVTVPFHHCDPLFVVWHGRYFEYFEQARTTLFQKLGLDVPQIRELGFRMYVTDARCRYMYPLSYGDVVNVRAFITKHSPLLRVAYDLRKVSTHRRVARGYTVLATTDTQGNLLTETPKAILKQFDSGS